MSSLFSYSFIVTNAYEKTRNENNEAIARTFAETATLLESENNLRGIALYSALSNAINDADGLSLAIQTQKNVENEQLNSQVISFWADPDEGGRLSFRPPLQWFIENSVESEDKIL